MNLKQALYLGTNTKNVIKQYLKYKQLVILKYSKINFFF